MITVRFATALFATALLAPMTASAQSLQRQLQLGEENAVATARAELAELAALRDSADLWGCDFRGYAILRLSNQKLVALPVNIVQAPLAMRGSGVLVIKPDTDTDADPTTPPTSMTWWDDTRPRWPVTLAKDTLSWTERETQVYAYTRKKRVVTTSYELNRAERKLYYKDSSDNSIGTVDCIRYVKPD